MTAGGGRTRRADSSDEIGPCETCGRQRPEAVGRCPWCGALDHPVPCMEHPSSIALACCAVCGIPVCSACRRGRQQTALCEMHARVPLFSGWAEAARGVDEVEAEFLAGRLRNADIDVQIFSQKDHANVVGLGALSLVRVLVPVFQLTEAQRVLTAETQR